MTKKIKFIFLLLLFCLIFSSNVLCAPWLNLKLTYDYSVHDYSAEAVYIKINNNELENLTMPPIIMDNMTLVPAREVLEHLGAVVDWKKDTEELFIAYEDNIAIIKIGSKEANCNGVIQQMPLAPKIINNKTMVPIRFVSEGLGFGVEWVNEERTIYITSPEPVNTTEPITQITTELVEQATNEAITENVTESMTELSLEENTLGSVEINNPFFKNEATSEENNELEATTSINSQALSSVEIPAKEVDFSKYNSATLKEINFNDDFYYDRNMGNLVISSAYISNGINAISQNTDTVNKKHYFSFDVTNIDKLSSGFFSIDDAAISRIDIFCDNGKMIVCFNEKSGVEYKVYENQGYVYFKPFV